MTLEQYGCPVMHIYLIKKCSTVRIEGGGEGKK